ncbi:hypothetical protein B7494_g4781 [Chlorociboria aeruginascens]|nr:hypothetical protein B7494_g4781 [Chlorociboria aeruginascens]
MSLKKHSFLSLRPNASTSTTPHSSAFSSAYPSEDEDREEAAIKERSTFAFLSLPSELRNKIYSLVFSALPTVIDLDQMIFSIIHRQKLLAIFFVSRQVHLESSHRFISTHTFRIFPIDPGRHFATKRPLLARIPAHYRSSITSLDLRLGPGWKGPPAGWVVNEALGLQDCTSVRVLNVFVEVDPSNPSLKGFALEGFYERFSRRLLDQILKAIPSIQVVEFDAWESVEKSGDMITGLVGVASNYDKIVAWGPERACGFPLISRRSSKKTIAGKFIFFSQHFGTGVLIATAFVHLLPTAFMSLTDPCLPSFFSNGYRPLAGLIAMFSALVVVCLEMFLTTRGAGHSHSHGEWDALPEEEDHQHEQTNGWVAPKGKQSNGRLGKLGLNRPKDISLAEIDASEGLIAGVSPLPISTPSTNGPEPTKFDDDDSDIDLDVLDPASQAHDIETPSTTQPTLSPDEERKRQVLQCLLLEAGILFHSIFIGMAVSVATGPPFVVFLVAIAFHQSFEGLALGSRIAAIHFPPRSPRPWLMVLAYGTTTPIGQAIGLFVHKLYDPHSAAGLLMVGVMNAISSGLLLFAGLVQLLAEDFLSDKSYGILKGSRRWLAWAAVIGGASLMALVGAWA